MSNALTEIAENDLLTTLEKDELALTDQLSQTTAEPELPSQESIRRIDALLDGLDAQEFSVLQLLFGLDGQEPLSAAAISQHTGLETGRVEQLRNKALARLRTLVRPAVLMNEN